MTLEQKLSGSIVVLDGAMGTELIARGLKAGERPESLNLTDRDKVLAVHNAYLDAGADIIYTNTFGSNPLKTADCAREVAAAVKIAREAVAGRGDKLVALDIGPTGKMLRPLGELGFEDAVAAFRAAISAGAAGADLIAIETMSDPYELKAAVVAAKECCELPVFATVTFGEDAKTLTGCSPEAAVALLEGLGVAALGINCSLGPAAMKDAAARILAAASVPVIVKPNAGLPAEREGRAVYSLSAADFAEQMKELVFLGARVVGGCCGTTPEYIRKLKAVCEGISPAPITQKALTVASSQTRAIYFGGAPVVIGERLNPTGKKRLKQALKDGDMAYVLSEGVRQADCGAHALDVNVGLPGIDEKQLLAECVTELQAVTELPLQIDTSDAAAMERAMRLYNGKPLVNSANGTKSSMASVFPLVKRYGGAVICLTLDERGIPPTAAGRVAIAKRMIRTAAAYGIDKRDLIFDTLATAVSADPGAARAALGAIRVIREKLGCNTSLGVSNISYGLPRREALTSTFLALALGAGLSAAICDPGSDDIVRTIKCHNALCGFDAGCSDYIAYATSSAAPEVKPAGESRALGSCIKKGLKAEAAAAARNALDSREPLDIINGDIIPALDEVGAAFEARTLFLPQLLMSAEAAGAAFGEIRSRAASSAPPKSTVIVTATVKGDIHDIGKNIVVMLLNNYGFTVVDLGRDVPPQKVAAAVKAHNAALVGLSALMTTTLPAMKETVALLKAECPGVKVCVGGAVLTADYAEAIGADKYCKDAMDTVRYAEEIERLNA